MFMSGRSVDARTAWTTVGFASLLGALSGCSTPAEEDGATGTRTAELRSCPVIPACDAPPPDPGPVRRFRHGSSNLVVNSGGPNHRGRDGFLLPGEPQWIIGKFAYGLFDKDLKDEDVDVYVLRNCGSAWEKLGTTRTTNGDEHPAVEGVEDGGGRVYFRVPTDDELGLGRHRVRLVVAGDQTAAELFIEVASADAPVFVSDVDGTLTTSENEEVGALLLGKTPNANDGAAEAFHSLVKKGYRPLYLTARAERLTARTRRFLEERGFPAGVVQTSFSDLGLRGDPAARFKADALQRIASRGYGIEFAFGNTATDAEAYASVGVARENRVFFRFDDSHFGGRTIRAYAELDGFASLPPTCQ